MWKYEKMTDRELCRLVLEKQSKPITASQVWEIAVKKGYDKRYDSCARDPSAAPKALLYTEAKKFDGDFKSNNSSPLKFSLRYKGKKIEPVNKKTNTLIVELDWGHITDKSKLYDFDENDSTGIYTLVRKCDSRKSGEIISYIGLGKKVRERIKQHPEYASSFQVAIVKMKDDRNLTSNRLGLIEHALIHYARKVHKMAGRNRIKLGPPKEDIIIHNTGHRHSLFHKQFEIMDREIISKVR